MKKNDAPALMSAPAPAPVPSPSPRSENLDLEIPKDRPLFLAEGKVQSLSDLANLLLEYGLFFRWIYFKNRPRGNLLFVRSILATLVLSLAYFEFFGDFQLLFLGIDLDPVIALGACAAAGYWNMASTFYKKSMTLAHFYEQIMDIQIHDNELSTRLVLNNFALQLLTMDLWGHRLYFSLFNEALEEAILALEPDSDSAKKYISRASRGELQSKEARLILTEYRAVLWRQLRTRPKRGADQISNPEPSSIAG